MDSEREWRRRKAENLIKGSREVLTLSGEVELRDAASGRGLTLEGYASRVNHWYQVGRFRERVLPQAFRRCLSEDPDVSLLLAHGAAGSGLPLARTRAGNLRLAEDSLGLAVDASLDQRDPDVQLLRAKMDAGMIDGMSMAFTVTSDDWNADLTERTLRSVSLHRGDVSVCLFGANDLATAELVARQATPAARGITIPDYTSAASQQLALLRLGASPRRSAVSGNGLPDHTSRARRELALLRRSGR
jgi:HK97 family phage prohead protease